MRTSHRPISASLTFGVHFTLALLAALPCLASENFPPPEFSRPYTFPQTMMPSPRAQLFAYVDIAVLILTLSLAAYLSLKKRSRRELVFLILFSLLYFGFFRRGCICAIGAIQNVSLAISDPTYAVPLAAAAFFAVPLLFTLFFGRVFCAAVCPLGCAQEAVLLRPIKVPAWLVSALGVIPYVYLGAAVLYASTASAFLICRYDPFVLFFRLSGAPGMFAFGVGMLLLSTFIGRPYCRFLCPYSVLLRMVAPFARWRPKTAPGECVNCNLCADVCPYGAIRPPTEPTSGGRSEGLKRLAGLVVALPVLMAALAALGYMSAPVLARVNPKVQLAEQLWLEKSATEVAEPENAKAKAPEAGAAGTEKRDQVKPKPKEIEAFELLGREYGVAYGEAAQVHQRFRVGSTVLGAWLGLILGLRLIGLAVRRRRPTYQVDVGTCVACARCYASCPVEHQRLQELAGTGLEETT